MSSSFRSILQQVTQEKLEELKRQKNLMTSHFEPVLKRAEDKTSNQKEILQLLYLAVKDSPVQDIINTVLVENLKYVLQNSNDDPSISLQLVSAWVEKMKQEIQYSLRKCEYSYLYGSLLSEWLEIEEKRLRKAAGSDAGSSASTTPMEVDEKPTIGTKDATLSKLKNIMFSKPSTEEFNGQEFRNFLSKELFDFSQSVESEKTLQEIIKETGNFFKIENYYVSTHDVECCIKGLSSDELLSPEKKAALKELSANPEALEEVASLLTNRLKNLKRWDWPSNISEDPTDIRRGLAGEYKAFLNEDIITALFLQYVGVEWAAHFKNVFRRIYNSRIWVKVESHPYSIEGRRKEFYERSFLSALPNSVQDQENKQQDEYARVDCAAQEECLQMSMAPQMASFGAAAPMAVANRSAPPRAMKMMAKRSAPQIIPIVPEIDFKQSFLHVLSTEIKLNQVTHPEKPLCVVQADLETFGPSIIHEAALIVMEYFGVNKDWLEFFQKFLQPRIKFVDGVESTKVQRGVPSAHVLSSLFGETLLFLLDFLINQKCNGMRVFRVSEELWFWNSEVEHVKTAWQSIQTYGKMVGLKVNESRSGSVAVLSEEELKKQGADAEHKKFCVPSPLPQRNIHWGYLELYSSGHFKIDKKAIEKFLQEMKVLLEKSECVLEWITIFNQYSAFFIRNFGKSAIASGKQHLDQIVEALRTIYLGVLGNNPSDPVEVLRHRYPKLKEANIVDAWAYWPLERGGLGLVNPFIGIMALRETFSELLSTEEDYFKKLPLEDKRIWEELKKEHEKHYGPVTQGQVQEQTQLFTFRPGQPAPPTRPKFPTWEEYIATRETELSHWVNRYDRLLERPGPKYPNVSDLYRTLDEKQENEIDRNYMLWLFSYYETQLLLHFGSVTFINSKLLPMSMIANIQKAKVKHN